MHPAREYTLWPLERLTPSPSDLLRFVTQGLSLVRSTLVSCYNIESLRYVSNSYLMICSAMGENPASESAIPQLAAASCSVRLRFDTASYGRLALVEGPWPSQT